jgi:hypothetical protein
MLLLQNIAPNSKLKYIEPIAGRHSFFGKTLPDGVVL